MKKIITLLLLLLFNVAIAQTFPVQNLAVHGTSSFTGAATFTVPIAVSSGGIGTGTAGGTALDNITGFASTGFLTRTGAGAYSFQSLTNGITLGNLAQQAANTVLANATGSTGNVTAFSMPSCSTSSSALDWTSATGFTCNSSINAATLGGTTFASPGPIGSGTPSTGAFTTLSASSTVSGSGFTTLLAPYAPLASPALTGSPTTPTLTVGGTTTGIANQNYVALHEPCVSIMDYGGDPTNTNDNSTPFSNAITASSNLSNKVCVRFPPGKFKFNSAAEYVFSNTQGSIRIIGAGADVTELTFPNSSAQIGFTYDGPFTSVHLANFSITTGQVNEANPAITLYEPNAVSNPALGAESDITNVTIRGADGYAVSDYWSTGIQVNGVSNVNFTNLEVVGSSGGVGDGVNIFGSATTIPVVYNFQGCIFYNNGHGIIYGNYVQGLTVNQSNFTGGGYGIYVPASETNLAQLTVTGSQFNVTAIAVDELTNAPPTLISSNMFIVSNSGFGINMVSAGLYSIVGNNFFPQNPSPTSTTGIDISSTSSVGVISGNSFYKMSSIAVFLGASTGGVNVQANVYSTNGTNVQNNGAGNSVGVATQ